MVGDKEGQLWLDAVIDCEYDAFLYETFETDI